MFRGDLKFILICNLIGSFGDGLYSSLLPVYAKDTLGADPVQIGILYAVMNLFAASTLLVSGILADKYDRKKIMILGWIMWLPAPLIFSAARSWIEMLPGMVMWGFWLGGPSSTAYIVTIVDKSRLTLTFTSISAAWSVGYIASPTIGGYLASTTGIKLVFYLAFILYGLASLALMFIKSQRAACLESGTGRKYTFFELLKTRQLMTLAAFFAALMFILMMFRPFIPTFVADNYGLDEYRIGILASISFCSSAVIGFSLGRLGDKSSKVYPVAASVLLSASSIALLLLTGNFLILSASFVLLGGSYITWSLLNAIAGPLAPESCRARWVAVPQTVSMFASITAPYLGGYLYAISHQYPFMVALAALPFLALVAVKVLR